MRKNYMQGKKTEQSKNRIWRIVKANMYGYMVTIIFLLFAALLMTYTNMGTDKEKWLILAGIIISALIAGNDTARGETESGWKWGMFGAAVYGIIYFIIAAMASRGNLLLCTNSIVMLCVMLCSGAVGGMVGINMKK